MKFQGTRHQQLPTKTNIQEVGLILFFYSILFVMFLPVIIAIIK